MPSGSTEKDPVFGFIFFGTPFSGALQLWVNLANDLHARGFPVHAWWAFDRMPCELDPAIPQRWLWHVARYFPYNNRPSCNQAVGRLISGLVPRRRREAWVLRHPDVIRSMSTGIVRRICDGVDGDPRCVRRFARELESRGVTHVLPMLAELSPWAFAAQRLMKNPPGVLVLYQSYEVLANYARPAGLDAKYYARLREASLQSPWPSVAISEDYRRRIVQDIGLEPSQIVVIPNGLHPLQPPAPEESARLVSAAFPGYKPGVPLLTFIGRRDPEKGIDLLLYAAAILRGRGHDFQLIICGPTIHGEFYNEACRHIAENLRLNVIWGDFIRGPLRDALFATSTAVVYPSIFREPFGLVATEAMSCGTPVIVPDTGGVADVIHADGRSGGLNFRSYDSGSLADQIERVLTDASLRRRLSEDGPRVARVYSRDLMTDRMLANMGLPPHPSKA